MESSPASSPLNLPEGLNYECIRCGRSCREYLEIVVDADFADAIRALPAGRLVGAKNPVDPVVESPWTPGEQVMRIEDGRCCMQQADGLCAIHAACGYDAKPPICRNFPFKYIQTPAGTFVGLSFACSAVLANQGPSVAGQRVELESAPLSKASRRAVADPLLLTETLPLTWAQYETMEQDLAALLDPSWGHIGQRLVMQSVYLRLLTGFLRQARELAGALVAGPEANEEPLAVFERRLRGPGGDLPGLIRRTAARRRVSPMLRRSVLGFALALQSTYTARRGRLASYLRATGQYFSFAAGRGALRLTEAGTVPYDHLRRIAFNPARPEFDELLTRYFRHRLFRKDLAVGDTLQTAHHLQLMHWGLIQWHAAALAAAAGEPVVGLTHLAEAVREVEKRFVFHTSFDRIFSYYPMLRGFMDRLFQNPHYAFAMGWGEWAGEP